MRIITIRLSHACTSCYYHKCIASHSVYLCFFLEGCSSFLSIRPRSPRQALRGIALVICYIMSTMNATLIALSPALKPPLGVLPNFHNPPSQRTANVVCQTLCLIISTLCVSIRMYTKFFIIRSHGCEDCELYLFCALSRSNADYRTDCCCIAWVWGEHSTADHTSSSAYKTC